jgi:hypothetical protein
MIKETGGNQSNRRFLFAIRRVNYQRMLYISPFERSRKPEAIKNKDVLSWPFDDSMQGKFFLGRLTSSSLGRRPPYLYDIEGGGGSSGTGVRPFLPRPETYQPFVH